MELIKEIESRREKNGKLVKWGLFFCEFCKQEVEKRLSNGLKSKSCGCKRYSDDRNKKISKSKIGKKRYDTCRIPNGKI